MPATIRFSVAQNGGDSINYAVLPNTTVREALEETVGVNLDGVSVLSDGIESNLDAAVQNGEAFTIQPKKYSSGC